MNKLVIMLIIFGMISSGTYASNHIYIHPPIPKEDPSTRKIAIVKVEGECSEQAINKLLIPFPSARKRTVFCEVFTGFSVEASLSDLNKLAANNKVEMVSPIQMYSVLQAEEPQEIIGADSIKKHFGPSTKKLTGKGIKIGIIDTGIYYTHPDLKKNYKKGWDIIDNDKDPMETIGQGVNNTLHGTHVAGIIAADGKMKGIAPNATIYAYRALGPGGFGTTEQILVAIERAAKDKVDILNLSLGSEVNGPDLPISLALNKLTEKGIITVAAAGNSGPEEWTVGAPGTASKAISVGASTPNMLTTYMELDNKLKFVLEPLKGSRKWEESNRINITDGGLGKKEDLKHVKGKVALIKRGELTFTEKVENAYQAGAKAVIIYNNINGPLLGSLEKEMPIPVASITSKEGEIVKNKLKKQRVYSSIRMKWEKDLLADFSSRGPVTDTWDIKPDVVAPGVVINSTVPEGYLLLQGTSMAAPHVAGACALLLEAHPNWSPEEVKAALMNTATILSDRENKVYKVYEQGAGRIDVSKALDAKVLIDPPSIRFGKFSLSDHLDEHEAFLTVRNISTINQWVTFNIPHKTRGISWTLPLSFTLKPNEAKKMSIKMKVDSKEFQEKLQDGHLVVNAGNQKIHLPFLYVIEEPDYPRIMGFNLTMNKNNRDISYEAYLPSGADEYGIALFDEHTLEFIQFLESKRDVRRGLIKGKITKEKLLKNGKYRLVIFAKKAGKEDMVEKIVEIK